MPDEEKNLTVRVKGELLQRLELTVEKIEDTPGAEANRSEIVREALDAYLEPLEDLEDSDG